MINWEFLTTLFFALTFVFVILMTIGFYVNYKRDQWHRRQKPALSPVKGRYFSRHIPEELHNKYAQYLEA